MCIYIMKTLYLYYIAQYTLCELIFFGMFFILFFGGGRGSMIR